MIDKYQPSNGTEGDCFHSKWCFTCAKCPESQDAKGQCMILLRTFVHSVTDPEYPEQWQYIDGKPVCTAYKNREEYNAERRGRRRGTDDKHTADMFDQLTQA
jgi:hypothetical protein